MHLRSSPRPLALLIAGALAVASLDARAASPPTLSRTDLFELDGDREPTLRLQAAIHDELRARSLAGGEVASITELRLAMGCKPDAVECIARGGRAMGLDRMIIGGVVKSTRGFEVELALVDVAAGDLLQEIHMPLASTALAADAIGATAVGLVDALFPGTRVPPVFSSAPMGTPTVDEAPPPQEPPVGKTRRPRWMWIGFGTSLGLTTVFAAGAIGATLRLTIGVRKDLLDAVDESNQDTNPSNDISREAADFCAAARVSPQNDGNVTNASVTRICNNADSLLVVRNTMLGFAAVGLASTVVFSILLAVNPKPRRHALTLAPRFDPRGGALVVGGRF